MAGGGNHNDAGINVRHGPTVGELPPPPSPGGPERPIETSRLSTSQIPLDVAYAQLLAEKAPSGLQPTAK